MALKRKCANYQQMPEMRTHLPCNWQDGNRRSWQKPPVWDVIWGRPSLILNLGCPARKVTGKLSGSALMRDEPLVANIFRCGYEGI